MKSFSSVVLLTFGLISANAQAALIYGGGTIPNLRAEAGYGFISVSGGFAGTTCDPTRVWVDMNSVQGRTAYATAMLAFASDKSVVIRLDDTTTRIFGACALYDIYVSQ